MRCIVILLVALASCATPRDVERIKDPGALGPYSAAVRHGDTVYLAGKVGRDRTSFAAEVSSSIDRIEADLTKFGLTLADVVSVNVYLTDIANYQELNGIYGQRFVAPYPARTCVAVKQLPGGAEVEITATAAVR